MTDTAPAARKVRAIPEGYSSLTTALVVHDAAAAIEFYRRAFGADELSRAPSPDGQKIWHAELRIGDSVLMLSDEMEEMGVRSPKSLGGSASSLHLYVEDADAVYQRAVDAGATASMPPMDAFWGDRYGKVTDPFGHSWGIATRKEELSHEEMERRAQSFAAQSV